MAKCHKSLPNQPWRPGRRPQLNPSAKWWSYQWLPFPFCESGGFMPQGSLSNRRRDAFATSLLWILPSLHGSVAKRYSPCSGCWLRRSLLQCCDVLSASKQRAFASRTKNKLILACVRFVSVIVVVMEPNVQGRTFHASGVTLRGQENASLVKRIVTNISPNSGDHCDRFGQPRGLDLTWVLYCGVLAF